MFFVCWYCRHPNATTRESVDLHLRRTKYPIRAQHRVGPYKLYDVLFAGGEVVYYCSPRPGTVVDPQLLLLFSHEPAYSIPWSQDRLQSYGVEEYPREKENKPEVVHVCQVYHFTACRVDTHWCHFQASWGHDESLPISINRRVGARAPRRQLKYHV